jgi:hypothetical protein
VKTITPREINLIDISKNLSILVFFLFSFNQLKNARSGGRIFLKSIWQWKNNILFTPTMLGVFYLMEVD